MPQLNQTLGSILIRKWELINQKAKTNAITCFCPLIKTVNWRITKADGGLIERVTWTIHSKFIFIVYDGPLPVVFPFFLILFQIFQIFFFIFFFKVSFNFLGRRSVPENPSVVYYLFIFFFMRHRWFHFISFYFYFEKRGEICLFAVLFKSIQP